MGRFSETREFFSLQEQIEKISRDLSSSGRIGREVSEHAADAMSEQHNNRLAREMRQRPPLRKTGLNHSSEVASLLRYEIPPEGFDDAELEEKKPVEPLVTKEKRGKGTAKGAIRVQGLPFVPKHENFSSFGTEDGVIAQINEARGRALTEAELGFVETVQPDADDRYAHMAVENLVPDDLTEEETSYGDFLHEHKRRPTLNIEDVNVSYGRGIGMRKSARLESSSWGTLNRDDHRARKSGVKKRNEKILQRIEQSRRIRRELNDPQSDLSQDMRKKEKEKFEDGQRLEQNRARAADILTADNRNRNPERKDWKRIQQEQRDAPISFEDNFTLKLESGEFTSLEPGEIFREFKNQEEKNSLTIRLHRLQEKRFLEIRNRENKTVEEIIYECFGTLREFFATYEKDIKDLQLAEGFVSPGQYLQKYLQRMLLDYPKNYASGDNYAASSRMDLLGKLRDSMAKAFEWSLRLPIENSFESGKKKTRKREMVGVITDFTYKMYKLIDQLPVLESFNQEVA